MSFNAAATSKTSAVKAVAKQLGIDLDRDDDLIHLAVEAASPESLPDGWTAYSDPTTSKPFYNNAETGKSQWEHPKIDFFRGAIFMTRGGKKLLKEAEAKSPPSTGEVAEMAEYMGIRADDPPLAMQMAVAAVNAPLPPGWEETVDEEGDPQFKNERLSRVQSEHPLDQYFAELVDRSRKGLPLPSWGREAARTPSLANAQSSTAGLPRPETVPEVTPAESANVQALLQPSASRSEDGGPAEFPMHSLPAHYGPGSIDNLPGPTTLTLEAISDQLENITANMDLRTKRDNNLDSRTFEKEEGDLDVQLSPGPPMLAGGLGADLTKVLPSPMPQANPFGRPFFDTVPESPEVATPGAELGYTLSSTARASAAAVFSTNTRGANPGTEEKTTPSREQTLEQPAAAAPATPPGKGTATVSMTESQLASLLAQHEQRLKSELAAQMAQVEARVKSETRQELANEHAAMLMLTDSLGPPPHLNRSTSSKSTVSTIPTSTVTGGQQEQQELSEVEAAPVAWIRNPPPVQAHPPKYAAIPEDKSLHPSPVAAHGAPKPISPLRTSQPSYNVHLGQMSMSAPTRGAAAGKENNLVKSPSKGDSRKGSVEGLRRKKGATEEGISVSVRLRPLERSQSSAWVVDQSGSVISMSAQCAASMRRTSSFVDTAGPLSSYTQGTNAAIATQFQFDNIYENEPDNTAVYRNSIKNIVTSAMQGINGTVFAYGQTGSGKTHTILGSKANPGVVSLAVADMFAFLDDAELTAHYTIKVGMLEIYNEELRDLLAPPEHRLHTGTRLQLKEDAEMGVVVTGLQEEAVKDVERVRALLEKGSGRRQTGATKMNENSSRSHTIFRITIESQQHGEEHAGTTVTSTLSFVDLAGSERLSKSGAEGSRAVESAQINLSLLALGNVIAKLADGAGGHGEFIPYRNSKLTRILQPSLGGNARTAIVATVRPGVQNAEETTHTLRFAARATKVTNRVQVNEVLSVEAQLRRCQREVSDLNALVQQQERVIAGAGAGQGLPGIVALSREKLALEERLAGLEEQNAMLQERLDQRPVSNTGLDAVPLGPPGIGSNAAKMAAVALDKALVNIARGAGTEGGRGGGGAGAHSVDEVVNTVRALRGERDDLRRRERLAVAAQEDTAVHLQELERFGREQQAMEAACAQMEEALETDAAGDLPSRMSRVAEGVAVLAAEMCALQRQRDELVTAAKQAALREGDLQAQMAKVDDATKQMRVRERDNAKLQDLLEARKRQRDEYCQKAGHDPEVEFGADVAKAETPAQEAALAYMSSLEAQLQKQTDRMRAAEAANLQTEKKLHEARTLATGEAGIGAVRKAIEATERAGRAEAALAEAEATIKRLKFQCEALEGVSSQMVEISELQGGEGDETSAMERMKVRVYSLSKEVAALTKERDELRLRVENPGAESAAANEGPLVVIQDQTTTTSTTTTTTNTALDSNNIPFNLDRLMNMVGNETVQPLKKKIDPADRPDFAMYQSEPPKGGAKKKGKKAQKTPKSWDDGSNQSVHDKDTELVKLRKRCVALERARQEMVAHAGAQARAAQLNLAAQTRAVQEKTAEVEHVKTALARAADHQQRQYHELQSMVAKLQDALQERDRAHAQLGAFRNELQQMKMAVPGDIYR